jgi:hypothetical protein
MKNEECPDTAAYGPRLAGILHSAFFILHSPEPPQGHIKATSRLVDSQVIGTLKPP